MRDDAVSVEPLADELDGFVVRPHRGHDRALHRPCACRARIDDDPFCSDSAEAGASLLDRTLEYRGVHRFDEMRVESGVARALSIGRLTVPGDRDEADVACGSGAEPPRNLVAIEARQPDVEQRDVRRELLGEREGRRAIVRDADLVTELCKHDGDRLG